MHEYSIVQALIERVAQEAEAQHASGVHKLWVSIGDLAGVERELLATAFETFKARTICESSTMEIRPVAARWECPRCHEERRTGQILRCDACAMPVKLVQGDEIFLDRIELEVNHV